MGARERRNPNPKTPLSSKGPWGLSAPESDHLRFFGFPQRARRAWAGIFVACLDDDVIYFQYDSSTPLRFSAPA
jgi:hypothetical protein